MLFPMYTVAADLLLKMTKVEPQEVLKAGEKGKSLQPLNPQNPYTLKPHPPLANPPKARSQKASSGT